MHLFTCVRQGIVKESNVATVNRFLKQTLVYMNVTVNAKTCTRRIPLAQTLVPFGGHERSPPREETQVVLIHFPFFSRNPRPLNLTILSELRFEILKLYQCF